MKDPEIYMGEISDVSVGNIETVTIRNQTDIDVLDISDETKTKMAKWLKRYSQFAYIKSTGYMFAGVDKATGNLYVNLEDFFFETKK